MRKPASLIFGLDDRPPLATRAGLALQTIAVLSISLIYPVLIGEAVGADTGQAIDLVSLTMIGSAIGVMLQALRTGSGYLVVPNATGTFFPGSLIAAKLGGMPMVAGMLLASAAVEIAIARFLRPLRALLPTEVAGFIVLVLGVLLGSLGIRYAIGTPEDARLGPDLGVAGGTLAVIVLASVWGRGPVRLFSALIGIGLGYAGAALAGLVDAAHWSQVAEAPWFRLPRFGTLGPSGGVSFDPTLILPVLIGSAAATLSTIGCLTTAQKINDADWRRQDLPSIARGVMADGLALAASALIGGTGLSASSSGVALSAATQATSRVLAWAIAAGLVLMALFPKLVVLVVLTPKPVIGAALLFLSCSFFVNGLEIISSRLLDARKSFTLGLSFAVAVGSAQIAPFAAAVPGWLQPVLSSPLFLAVTLVLILNPVLRLGIRRADSLVLPLDAGAHDRVSEFLTQAGADWGARRDVVMRAANAVAEVLDSLSDPTLGVGEVRLDLGFDELQLDVRLAYRGPPLELLSQRPSDEDILHPEHGARRLAGYIVARLADSATGGSRDGLAELRLVFDH